MLSYIETCAAYFDGARYKKGELEGKNVNCLMPQPFSMRHNSYLNNYITTGHAKLLDVTREVSSRQPAYSANA